MSEMSVLEYVWATGLIVGWVLIGAGLCREAMKHGRDLRP